MCWCAKHLILESSSHIKEKPYSPISSEEDWCFCKSSNWMCKLADLSSFTLCFWLNFWSHWPCCCCRFATCKSCQRPGRQAGKSWNSFHLLSVIINDNQGVYCMINTTVKMANQLKGLYSSYMFSDALWQLMTC